MNIQPIWPGWETVRLIGRGSFGAVYEIERDMLGEKEKAALKVISIPQSESDIKEMYSDGYDDESITSTFQEHLKSIVAEYSLMRKLNGSANVVNCDDVRYVQHDDGLGWDIYIKMELLTPLADALPADIPEEQVIKIGKDLCHALVQCRQFDIVHRDIKPQNIFVSALGDYKLGDFGIAKTVEKTSGGTKVGTYKYMAPEVYNNRPYGAGADIYSLGLVLYWLLNERRMPFLPMPPEKLRAGMEEQARLRRFNGEQIPTPAHGSEELKRIVLRACAYDPKDRYASAEEMLRELEELGGGVRSFVSATPTATQPAAEEPTAGVPHPKAERGEEAAAGARKTKGENPGIEMRPVQHIEDVGTVGVFKTSEPAGSSFAPVVREAGSDGTVGVFSKSEQIRTEPVKNTAVHPPAPSEPEKKRAAAPIPSSFESKTQPSGSTAAETSKGEKKGLLFGVIGGILALAVILIIVLLPKDGSRGNTEYVFTTPNKAATPAPAQEHTPSTTITPTTAPTKTPVNAPRDEGNRDLSLSFYSGSMGGFSELRFTSASATSELEEDGILFSASYAIQDDVSRPWVEGVSGSGIGETLSLYFDQPQRVSLLSLRLGYARNPDFYWNNNRPKTLRFTFSDGRSAEISFEDRNETVYVLLSEPIETQYVKITIQEVYQGTYNDTCIYSVRAFS